MSYFSAKNAFSLPSGRGYVHSVVPVLKVVQLGFPAPRHLLSLLSEVVVVLPLATTHYRIAAEEKVLIGYFGDASWPVMRTQGLILGI
jgi:hypothetical protein